MSSKDTEYQELIEKIRQFCGTDVEKFDTYVWQVLAEYLRGEFKLILNCLNTKNPELAKTLLESCLENYDRWVERKKEEGPPRPWGG